MFGVKTTLIAGPPRIPGNLGDFKLLFFYWSLIVPNYAKVIFVIFEFNFQSSIITVNAVNSIVQKYG